MREVKIQGKKYTVPDQWQDCTVDHLIRAMRVLSENINPTAKAMQLMQAVTNIPNRVLQTCNLEEANLLSGCLDFITALPPVDAAATNGKITLDGVTYTAPEEIGRMEFQQYVDFEVKIEDTQGKPWEMIPYALAIYMSDSHKRPYDSNEMLKQAEAFKQLPVIEANNLAGFFLLNGQLSSVISQACTVKMASMRIMQATAISRARTTPTGLRPTRGMRPFTISLKEILIRWLLWSASKRYESLLSYTSQGRKRKLWSWTSGLGRRIKPGLQSTFAKMATTSPKITTTTPASK